MGSAAGLAYAWAGFQERDFAGGQAAVMDELFAQGTARPAAAEKRFVAVETLQFRGSIPSSIGSHFPAPFLILML
jgi:hypothetical protein